MTTSKRPILVSFSGIDGAGKSTQITHLEAAFQSLGLRVRVIPFWDEIAALTGVREGAGQKVFRGDPGVGSPEAPIERRDKNVRTPGMTFVRLALYLLDALSLRWTVWNIARYRADVIIFDRFIYDELANLDLDRRPIRWYVRCVLAWSPRPHTAIVLDAVPEDARRRKPEYPLAFLHENREAYLRMSRLANLVVIGPLPLEEAKAETVSRVFRDAGLEPVPAATR